MHSGSLIKLLPAMSESFSSEGKHFNTAVTLIGAGKFTYKDIDEATEVAPAIVCADGGANRAMALGHIPDLVVGDLDSIFMTISERLEGKLVKIEDQSTTDFEKCLSYVTAPLFICIGFCGGRIDHELDALATLATYDRHPAIMVTPEQVCFRAPAHLVLRVPLHTTVSLFPFNAVKARSKGLEWPVDDHELHPSGMIGTSNRTVSPSLELWVDRGNLLVILPRSELMTVVDTIKR